MNMQNLKNIVVLKELPSNIVEEAIVILKENVNIKNIEKKKENVKVTARAGKKDSNYILKEAESVVANYISALEKPKQLEIKNSNLKKKYERAKGLTAFFAFVALLGIVVNFI